MKIITSKKWKEQIPGGEAQGKSPEDYDPDELKHGIEIEQEHVKGADLPQKKKDEIATEIAMDHLEESQDFADQNGGKYYQELEKAEKNIKKTLKEKTSMRTIETELFKEAKKKGSKYPKSEITPYNPWAVCFVPGTNITMADGSVKKIEDVQENDLVMTHLGHGKKIIRTMARETSENVLKIKVSGTPGYILCTKDHPFLCMKSNRLLHAYSNATSTNGKRWYSDNYNGHLDWVEAKNLSKGDAIHSPSAKIEDKHLLNLDEDTAFVLGLYCAKGFLSFTGEKGKAWRRGMNGNVIMKHIPNEKSGKIILILNKDKDAKLIDFVRSFVISRMGRDHFDIRGPYNKNPNVVSVIIKSLSLAKICREHIGSGSSDKKLSMSLMSSSEPILQNFLFGYFLGDGCFNISEIQQTNNRYSCFGNQGLCEISATSASQNLINQLFWMCEKCGLVSSVYLQQQNREPGNRNKKYYINGISLNASETCKLSHLFKKFFGNHIDLSTSNHKGQRFAMAACTFGKIISIEEVPYIGKVYNLEVEDDNSYVANLCSVHNCNKSTGGKKEAPEEFERCVQHIKEQNREENAGKKKSKRQKKEAQRGPAGPDNPSSDDLGLSPEFTDPANIEYGGEDAWSEESVMREKGPGIYYSITNDIPVGPFKTMEEARSDVVKHFRNQDFNLIGTPADKEQSLRWWLDNTEFFLFDGEKIEDYGNYYEVDPELTFEPFGGYWEGRGHAGLLESNSMFDLIKFAKKKKKWNPNPWAVCRSQGLKPGSAKEERCIQDVKKKQSEIISELIKEAKKKKKQWIQDAVKKEGSFTSWCKRKGYDGVTDECIAEGKKSTNATTRRRANLAEIFRKNINKKKKSSADILDAIVKLANQNIKQWFSIALSKNGLTKFAQTKPEILPPAIKRNANKFLYDFGKQYWPEIPIKDIIDGLKAMHIDLVNEDGTPFSALFMGENGRASIDLTYHGQPIKNSMLYITWHKMPSGKYEIVAYLG